MKVVYVIPTSAEYYGADDVSSDDASRYARLIARRVAAENWGDGVEVEIDLVPDTISSRSYVAEGDEDAGQEVIEGIRQFIERCWVDWIV